MLGQVNELTGQLMTKLPRMRANFRSCMIFLTLPENMDRIKNKTNKGVGKIESS